MHHQRPAGPCPGWWGATCLPAGLHSQRRYRRRRDLKLEPPPGLLAWLVYIHTCYTVSLSRGQGRVTDGFLACFGRPSPAPSVDPKSPRRRRGGASIRRGRQPAVTRQAGISATAGPRPSTASVPAAGPRETVEEP